jgi:hypothetical protein
MIAGNRAHPALEVLSTFLFIIGLGVAAWATGLFRYRRRRYHDWELIAMTEGFVWNREWKETEYTRRLADHLAAAGILPAKHQAPLQQIGTRFDVLAVYRREHWLITAKKGLDNQSRMVLQGEIEDAIRDWQHPPRTTLHVLVLIGIEQENAETGAQYDTLIRHLGQRTSALFNASRSGGTNLGRLVSPDSGYEFHAGFVPVKPVAQTGTPAGSVG